MNKDMLCIDEDIYSLYLRENIELTYPDAWMCRIHRQCFSTYQHAQEHIERVLLGDEKRIVRRVRTS